MTAGASNQNRSVIPSLSMKARVVLFAAVTLLAVGFAVTYTLLSRAEEQANIQEQELSAEELAALQLRVGEITSHPHVVFLDTDGTTYHRKIAVSDPDDIEGQKATLPLDCQRVYFAGGAGLCMGEDSLGDIYTFNAEFQKQHTLEFPGIPSRARISPDGKYGAVTVFVTGDSYALLGFSTRTAIIDMQSGEFIIKSLEDMTVTRDGEPWWKIDFNFWGVTFIPNSTQFFATLGTGGQTYLVLGDFETGQATVLRENVECPSLSPDGTRIVYKHRTSFSLLSQEWRLHVLDLATMTDQPLAESRSVDDQAEWLDNDHVVYSLRNEGPPRTVRPDLWVVPADGSGEPELMAEGAMSPAFVE